jgi:hypothetical protein
LECDLEVSFNFTGNHMSTNRRYLLPKFNRLLNSLRAKRFGPGKDMNRFEPVGFPLAIITVDDVELRSPGDLATKVTKVDRFSFGEEHREILASHSHLR